MTRTAEPPLGHFEGRLLAELKEAVAGRPADDRPASRGPRRRRAALLAVTATGAAAAVAVSLVLTVPGHTGPTPPAGYSLDAFMTAAAAAARAQGSSLPAPDQAFYTKEDFKVHTPGGDRQGCEVLWDLYPLSGRGVAITSLGRDACGSRLLRALKVLRGIFSRRTELQARHYYPPLGALPDKPAALRSALSAAAGLGPGYWGMQVTYTTEDVIFTLAGRLLDAPASGALRAAVYQVIAGLPGVTLIRDATDAAGRRGVGVQLHLPSPSGGRWTLELIIDPVTYQFLGTGMYSKIAGWQSQIADVGSGLVTRPAS